MRLAFRVVALFTSCAYSFSPVPEISSYEVKPRSSVLLKGKGGLEDALNGRKATKKSKKKEYEPKWVNVDGVSIPDAGKIKAWELNLGDKPKKFACVRPSQEQIFLVDGECTKCGFDLWQGECVPGDVEGAKGISRVTCPTCFQMYDLANGDPLGIQQKDGFAGWVGGLARSANANKEAKPIKSYPIRVRTKKSDSDGEGGGIIVEADFQRTVRR